MRTWPRWRKVRCQWGAETTDQWEYGGDVDAALADAQLVLDETIFHQSLSHQPMETRSAMAYWQNGKLYLHGSTQSTARTVGSVARWCGVDPEDVVVVAEYCGGGFGSKISGAISMRIPALLAKKAGKPVMMRITRQEENFIGRARPGFQGRVKMGFRQDGRLTAVDLFLVQDGGPYGRSGDFASAASTISLAYQPVAMRFSGLTVYTNTPPRAAQRAPGGVQAVAMLAPVLNKAAHQLGIDPAELHRVNAPSGEAEMGPPGRNNERTHISCAFVREAIDKGVEIFNWTERLPRAGQRNGTKATGLGIAVSPYTAGSSGLDGLMTVRPDGKLYVQQGLGNLGTESFSDTARHAAETLGLSWDQVEIIWGDTSKHLPWSAVQAGSQSTHAHTRANLAAAEDLKLKLQEIAAGALGGAASSYDVDNGRVFRMGSPSQGMTFARAAERAIELGGKFDGHELPEDINGMTTRSATALAGLGVMGVARDNYSINGRTFSFVVGFAEVEVDIETGHVRLVDYAATADCGTVMHPRSLGGQMIGGGIQGFGVARGQKWVYDQKYGLAVAKRFYSNKPPTILDVPVEQEMKWAAAEIPDPASPVGAKGIGEPPQGAGAGAVLAAISNALGEQSFNRSPVTADMILSLLESVPSRHKPMAAHV